MELGERIGDVKQERWQVKAQSYISRLQKHKFCSKDADSRTIKGVKVGSNGKFCKLERKCSVNDAMCQVCLCNYDDGDEVITMPCTHCFHSDCVSTWLKDHSTCPICKMEIEEALDSADVKPAAGNDAKPEPTAASAPSTTE